MLFRFVIYIQRQQKAIPTIQEVFHVEVSRPNLYTHQRKDSKTSMIYTSGSEYATGERSVKAVPVLDTQK